jgi:ABC-2 type transport system ATP-binding protein
MPLRKFSKGMLQRIGIAQAILHDPEVVLLDEPMSGLDPMGRREVRELIAQMKAEGKTVFFSTHILSDAEALCDRVAILNRGKLVGVGSISELLEQRSAFEAVLECSLSCAAGISNQLQGISAKPVTYSGGQYRAIIAEENMRDLLALCQAAGVRLISVNPLRGSLEDYFSDVSQPKREQHATAATTAGAERV